MWFDCVERKRRAGLLASASAPRAVAAAPSFQACLRACICTFCMCVCIYVYVCIYGQTCREIMLFIGKPKGRHVYMYVYACVYVYVI